METPYKIITTADELRDAVSELSKYPVIGFDTETTDLDPYKGRMRLVQLGTPEGFVYIFDLDRFASGDMRKVESLEPLRKLLAAQRPVKVAQNVKFDAKWISHYLDVELGGEYDSWSCTKKEVERGGLFDTLLASQIVSAGDTEDRHSLQMVVERYLNEPMDKSAQLSDWSGELSASQLEYAARDAAILLPLREKLVERIKADSLGRVAQLEFECAVPIAEVELAGVFLDVACWREQIAVVQKKRTILAEELQGMLAVGATQGLLFANARADINLDSHTQVMAALKRLGIELPDSTRNWKLQPLAAKYEQIAKLLEYRTVQKSLTSYGENIINEINPKTGRIHANFHQIGAPTGRMACTNPNVQQVPHAIEYRRCFRAPEGRKLVISDYCVAAGTRVATKRGLLPIEEVQADDKVFLEDGSFAHVSAIIKRGKLSAVTLTLKNGYSLTATSLHRIRVIDVEGRYVWRRIGELKDTDFVAIQPGRGLHDDLPYVELPQAASQHFNNHKSLRTPFYADERLATFMGYISGDGTLRRNVIVWVANSQDRSLFRTINDLASELFGIPVHNRGEYRGVCEAGLYSVPLAKWCLAVGLSKSRVPEFLWRSNPSVVASYLRGLFEADGSVTNSDTGKVSFSSSRKTLATEVHQLLLALGIPATLREQQNTGPNKKFTCWHVSVVAAGLSNFFEQVGFISERKQAKLRSLVARQTGKIVVGSMPNLQKKTRGLHLSGEVRRLLNNTASLGRPVSPQLARTLERDYPEISLSLGLGHITGFKQLFLPVAKIEPAGEIEVFDLSVPGPMTYLSDGFVSHNSQIELRILADFTGDEGFINAFNSGADLHKVTAAQVFNVPLEEVTADQRSFAKRLNFGVVYGIGAQRFSMMTGLSQTEAEDLLRRYFATYRALDTWLRDAALRALRERCARTASGRLARFNFDPADKQAASSAQRNGKNTPIQGCVHGDTRIFEVGRGYVPIREMDGQAVSVWDGMRFSNALVAYSGKKQKVKVTLWGGHYIECSPDHKFLVIDANGRQYWRTPTEFKKLNWVVLTEGIKEWSSNLLIPKPKSGSAWNASKASLADISDKLELGVFLGRTASDGSVSERQVTNLVAEHEREILPYLQGIAGQLGHVTVRPAKREQGRKPLYQLANSSLGVARQLLQIGIKDRIPDVAWRDRRVLAGYLRGMFDGDGTVNRDGAVLTFGKGPDFHLQWALEIQQALLLFGIRSRINQCASGRINVCVLKRDMPLFSEHIGFINSVKQKKALDIKDGTGHKNRIYGRAARIKSIEVTDEWVDMYDVINSETGRFMANGLVVHNSSADILKRALRLLHDKLRGTSACIVNMIHDEIVVEADAAQAEEIGKVVEDAMCRAGEEYVKKVPVKVETEIADAWVK